MTSTKTRSRSLRVATTLLAFLAPPKTLTRSCCTREVPLLANKLVENLDGVKAPHDDTAETSRMVENFIETEGVGNVGTGKTRYVVPRSSFRGWFFLLL